jgi:glycosyltransferase involved in cell wall biosynthesis
MSLLMAGAVCNQRRSKKLAQFMRFMTYAALRTRLRLDDLARTHHLSVILGLIRLATSQVWRRVDLADSVARLIAAGLPRRFARPLLHWATKRIALPDQRPARINPNAILERSIIVKPPSPGGERGILFVSFEGELARVLNCRRFEVLQDRYQLAFLPTWQPAHSRELLYLAARSACPFVVMPASRVDLAALPRELPPHCLTVDLQASSWVSSRHFTPTINKDIDLILLANFSKYKRHWKLFEGLSQLRAPLRVVCAGRPWGGRQRADLEAESAAFGVRDMIDIIDNPTDQQVADLLARSRMFCAMSYKEGSFVAVAESLVAGTPVGMFSDATIGTKQFINEKTGFLFARNEPLGPQLESALERCAGLKPREWACREIVAEQSILKFNRAMRAHSLRLGAPWTHDGFGVYSRNFTFGYLNRTDELAMSQCYAELAENHGLRVRLLPAIQVTGAN